MKRELKFYTTHTKSVGHIRRHHWKELRKKKGIKHIEKNSIITEVLNCQ